jgi:hypothetical protein
VYAHACSSAAITLRLRKAVKDQTLQGHCPGIFENQAVCLPLGRSSCYRQLLLPRYGASDIQHPLRHQHATAWVRSFFSSCIFRLLPGTAPCVLLQPGKPQCFMPGSLYLAAGGSRKPVSFLTYRGGGWRGLGGTYLICWVWRSCPLLWVRINAAVRGREPSLGLLFETGDVNRMAAVPGLRVFQPFCPRLMTHRPTSGPAAASSPVPAVPRHQAVILGRET